MIKKTTILVLCFFLYNSILVYGQIPQTGQQIAYYPFSGNVNDVSGNGYNGTTYGSPTLTTDRFGNSNFAYSFDGVDDYIYFGNAMYADLPDTDADGYYEDSFSISIWAKSSVNAEEAFLAFGESAGLYTGMISRIGSNLSFNSSNWGISYTTSGKKYDGIWHQYVLVYSAGSFRKMYIDGSLIYQNNDSQLRFNFKNYGVSVGVERFNSSGTPEGTTNAYTGSVDEVRLWNIALTNTEVSSLYAYENDSSNTIIDNTSPTASLAYSVSGTTVSSVSANDVVTITATFNEDIADSPVMQLSGSGVETISAANMTKASATSYTYTWTVGSGDGTQTFALATGTDITGNTVTATPTSGATIVIDAPQGLTKHGEISTASANFVDKHGETGSDAVSANGGATVTPLQNSLYISSVNSQYLSFSKPSSFNATGDYTFETYIKYNTLQAGQMDPIFGGGQSDYISVYNGQFGTRINVNNPCGGDRNFFSSSNFTTGTWHHIAVVRSGSTVTAYLDGVATGNTTSCTGTFMNSLSTTYIGKNTWRSGYLDAHISNMRYVVGTAVYTSNFVPPTTVLTAISGTEFLLLGNDANSPLTDSSGNNITVTGYNSPTITLGNGPF